MILTDLLLFGKSFDIANIVLRLPKNDSLKGWTYFSKMQFVLSIDGQRT